MPPTGVHVMSIRGSTIYSAYAHVSAGCLCPDATGDRIYTQLGIFDSEAHPRDLKNTFRGAALVPAVQGPFYLRLPVPGPINPQGNEPPVTLHLADQPQPLLAVPGLANFVAPRAPYVVASSVSYDKRIFFNPQAEVIAVVAPTMDAVTLRHFNVEEELKRAGVDYLVVLSSPPRSVRVGETVEYQVDARSSAGPVSYRLESGPQGMAVSKTGLLRWPARPCPEGNTIGVIVALSDATGQAATHSFSINLDDGREVAGSRPPRPVPGADGGDAAAGISSPPVRGDVPLVELDALKGGSGEEMSPKEIARSLGGSVVLVRSGASTGSGFVVGASGYIVTCAHCLQPGQPTSVLYHLKDDKESAAMAAAKTVRADRRMDVALLKIAPKSPLRPVNLSIGVPVESGERVCAIGNPGLGSMVLETTITEGIVSSPRRRLGAVDFIQTSAAINPGSSGGPLFNSSGLVIGQVARKATTIENVGFALPADAIARFLLSMCKTSGPEAAIERDWINITGEHHIQAAYVDYRHGAVRLRKANGSEIEVPLEKLSAPDQAFLHMLHGERWRTPG